LLKGYFLAQWEVAQIILLLKPVKPNELTFYRPISLSTVSKVLEKTPLKNAHPNGGK
jgi:hypothetical protein